MIGNENTYFSGNWRRLINIPTQKRQHCGSHRAWREPTPNQAVCVPTTWTADTASTTSTP